MIRPNQFHLLTERRFLPFFLAQLSGAFNDNLYKNVLVLLVTYQAASYTSLDPGLLANLAAGVFILPFVLFSATGGQLADRYDKSVLIRTIKFAEVLIMALACYGLALKSLPLLLAALFLMGTHSAFFGPVKYSILPRVLKEDELTGGNGLVESGTFAAILIGTVVAGLLAGASAEVPALTLALVGVAAFGFLCSLFVPSTQSADPSLKIGINPITGIVDTIRFARQKRSVFLSVLGISWFWFFGALLLSQFPNYAKSVLGGDEHVVTLLLMLFSVGVAVGSLLCERLSAGRVEIGLVPFGSIGITLFAADLYFATPAATGSMRPVMEFIGSAGSGRLLVDLFLLGLFGGFYIVPLYGFIQTRTQITHTSRIVAANNILNALFMVAAAGIAALLLSVGLTIPELILTCALFNAAVAFYIYTLVPEYLWRFVDWMLVHTIFRLKKTGLENIPEEGPALLVCNHVSFADAMVLAAAVHRPVRFVMDHKIYNVPVLNFLFRAAKVIPIAPAKVDPVLLERAFEEVDRELATGEIVCIFPEGKLTADGEIGEFRPGVARILERRPVPVLPVAISGLWESPFSRFERSLFKRFTLGTLFRRLRVAIGEAVASGGVTPELLRARVVALRGDWK
ncbi:MAG: MFS transporter [Betaproteobacteria bacterium]|nr:MFS transporter [Betaproteobacteria bacterium]